MGSEQLAGAGQFRKASRFPQLRISIRWAWWLLCAAALFAGVRYFRYTTTDLGAGHFLVRDRVSGEICHYKLVPGGGITRFACTDP